MGSKAASGTASPRDTFAERHLWTQRLPWLFLTPREHVLLDYFSLGIMIPVQGGKGLIKFSAGMSLCY